MCKVGLGAWLPRLLFIAGVLGCAILGLAVMGQTRPASAEDEPELPTTLPPAAEDATPLGDLESHDWRQSIPPHGKGFSDHKGVFGLWSLLPEEREVLRFSAVLKGGVFSNRLRWLSSPRPSQWQLFWKGTYPKTSFKWGTLSLKFEGTPPAEQESTAGVAPSSPENPSLAGVAPAANSFEIRAQVLPNVVTFYFPTSRDKNCREGVAFDTKVDQSATLYQLRWCDGFNGQGVVLYAPYRDPQSTTSGFVVCPRMLAGEKLTGVTQLKESSYRATSLLTDVTAHLQVKLLTGRAQGYVLALIRTGGVLPPALRSVDELQSVDPEVETWYSSVKERAAQQQGNAGGAGSGAESTPRDRLWAGVSLQAVQHYQSGDLRLFEAREAVRVEELSTVAEQTFTTSRAGHTISVKTGEGLCYGVLFRQQLSREAYFEETFDGANN